MSEASALLSYAIGGITIGPILLCVSLLAHERLSKRAHRRRLERILQ